VVGGAVEVTLDGEGLSRMATTRLATAPCLLASC
jgi:hypothetical protein